MKSLVCLLCLLVVVPAVAEENRFLEPFRDGNYLLAGCRAALELEADSESITDPEIIFAAGYCLGVVAGTDITGISLRCIPVLKRVDMIRDLIAYLATSSELNRASTLMMANFELDVYCNKPE